MSTSVQKRVCMQHTMHDNYFNVECMWCIVEQRSARTKERDAVAYELAAALREIESLKEHCQQSDKELVQLTDALGCPCEIPDSQQKALNRVRDLISAEGELGDFRSK